MNEIKAHLHKNPLPVEKAQSGFKISSKFFKISKLRQLRKLSFHRLFLRKYCPPPILHPYYPRKGAMCHCTHIPSKSGIWETHTWKNASWKHLFDCTVLKNLWMGLNGGSVFWQHFGEKQDAKKRSRLKRFYFFSPNLCGLSIKKYSNY